MAPESPPMEESVCQIFVAFGFYLLRRKERGNRSRDQILSTSVGVAQLCQVKDLSIYTQTSVPIGCLGSGFPYLIGYRGSSVPGWVSKRQEQTSHNTRDERQGNSCSRLLQPFTLSLLELLSPSPDVHAHALYRISPPCVPCELMRQSNLNNVCHHILLKLNYLNCLWLQHAITDWVSLSCGSFTHQSANWRCLQVWV